MTDQNLGPGDNQLVTSMGRVRGLVAVWKEAGRRRDRIWLNACPTLVHGRAATLALLSEMVAQNATRRPGDRNLHPMGRGLAGVTSNTSGPSPSMGRVRAKNPGPHPCIVDPPLQIPHSWPQYLCRCRYHLPALPSPPFAEPAPPRPPSHESDTDSTSGSPSLETVMGSESGYEASGLASSTD